MNRTDALAIVKEFVKNLNLVNHMLAVESGMTYYAMELSQDLDTWQVTGLLHDFDWEIHPNLPDHPLKGAPLLREKGVPEEIVRAILSHSDLEEYPRQSLLEKGLFACDEITGMITAVALVRPSRSLYDLEASSVKKKWKDRAFAAGANREEMELGAGEFGVELWKHTENMILAMRVIAPELGLSGNLNPDGTPI